LFGFLGISTDFLDAINTTAAGPFGLFLDAIGKTLTTLTFILAIIDISGNPDCSVGEARFLIISQTLWTFLLIGALAFVLGPLALPALFAFFMLFAMSFAISKAMTFSEKIVCDGR
jgi:hypothetical protein